MVHILIWLNAIYYTFLIFFYTFEVYSLYSRNDIALATDSPTVQPTRKAMEPQYPRSLL